MNNEKKLRPAVYFEQVNKLVDTFSLWLDSGVSLNLYVDLDNSKDNERFPVVKEFVYKSKYTNMDMGITIKRKFTPYLSIDYPDELEPLGKGQVRMYYTSIIGVREKLKEVDEKLSDAFMLKKDTLIMVRPFIIETKPSKYSSIKFSPIIFTDTRTNEQKAGVNLLLNNRYSLNLSIERFEGFRYIVESCDLYGWASTYLSSYTGDLLGTNPIMMEDSENQKPYPSSQVPQETPIGETVGFKNTKPISKEEKIKSFFDD